MKKLIFALLTAALLIPAAPASGGQRKTAKSTATEAPAVMLRESIIVNTRLVRLGDLFTVSGDKADIAVAYAPQPGQRAIFDARWLYRVARSYGLKWRPLSIHEQIVVQRDSQVITRDEIEDRIRAALIERGAAPNTKIELSNRLMRLHVPANAAATVAVEDVTYEPRTGRFTAILSAPADDPSATRTRATGRLHEVAEIPVPARRVLAREVINQRDLKWVKWRRDRLPRGIVTDIDDLLGMASKRGLQAGVPVRMSSIQRPILVPKNSLVTIFLRAPRMTLTAQGKALEDGSDGDTIRITNTQSNKVIEAEVTGVGKAAVLPSASVAMN